MMTAQELVRRCVDVAQNYKTLYVMGCFGAPMTAANKKRYTQNHDYNKATDRTRMINAATADTFGFDCVCLIKGILWGWSGDTSKTYGGASYASNGVADVSADGMIQRCRSVSADFRGIVPGAAVWMPGHIGVYIGDGLAVECTPRWKNCVQITAVGNLGKKAGYNTRTWTKWGKLPYVDYSEEDEDMDQDKFNQMFATAMQQYRQSLQNNDCGAWSEAARRFAIENGIFAGGGTGADGQPNYMWQDLLTREQAAQILYRFAQKFGQA